MPGYLDKVCITELFDKPGLVQIDGLCPICGKHWNLCVTQTSLTNYMNGMLIQKAFLGLSPQNRELLQSGLCKECWDDTFKETDDV